MRTTTNPDIRRTGTPSKVTVTCFWTELWLSEDGAVRIGQINDTGIGAQPATTDLRWPLPQATRPEHEALYRAARPS